MLGLVTSQALAYWEVELADIFQTNILFPAKCGFEQLETVGEFHLVSVGWGKIFQT